MLFILSTYSNTIMVSYLVMKLDINGDYTTKIDFTASMSDRSSRKDKIFFPPTFEITNEIIRKAVPDAADPKDVFTSKTMYMRLATYATDPNRGYKAITLKDAEPITEDNIKYMIKLWLSNGTSLMLNNRVYNIVSTKPENNKGKIVFERKSGSYRSDSSYYHVNITVKVIQKERDNFVNRQRITCDDKRKIIDELSKELFGDAFFLRRDPFENENRLAPTLATNNYGQTTGRTQISQSNTPYNNYVRGYSVAPMGALMAAPQQVRAATFGGKKKRKKRNKRRGKTKKRGKTYKNRRRGKTKKR